MKFLTAIGIALLATTATSALAQSLPRYDPATYCKGVSDYSGGSSVVYNGCIEMEQSSYDELKPRWAALSSKTRNYYEEVARYSDSSYVILKGCVDMEADAVDTKIQVLKERDMKTISFAIAISATTLVSGSALAEDQFWVKVEAVERKTCPSVKCGTVGKLSFRESAKVLETRNGWGRVTHFYDASCSGGKSQYVDSGRAVCDKSNGIVGGKFAEWVKLDALSKERPAQAKAGNSAIEQALKDSDRYDEHKDRFIAAAEELMASGQCKLQDFIDQGGWVRSTQKSRGVGIYFTYCNGGAKRVYLDVNTGKVSTN